jgi:hypothetical protein
VLSFHNTGAGTEASYTYLNYVTHASNETTDNTWIEYPDETTPLLQHFMFPNNIARHLTYDAKTHNFKTDDVNNIYGRADFTDGVSGKNVNVNNRHKVLILNIKAKASTSIIVLLFGLLNMVIRLMPMFL